MCDISDVHDDLKEHLGVVGSSLTRRIRGRSIYQQVWNSANERTSLLPDAVTGTASKSSTPGNSFSSSGSECIDVVSEMPSNGNTTNT